MKISTLAKSLLTTLLCALPQMASADVVIDQIKYVTNTSDMTASAMTDNYEITTANILATVTDNGQTFTVTKIAARGFYRCYLLTSITLPGTITEILDNAIADCNTLTSLRIPASVTYLDKYALWGNRFTSLVVEPGNTVYDSRNGCNAVIETATNTLVAGCQATIIPTTVTAIGEFAFRGCDGLTSITLPNSLTYIGKSAFNGCDLTSLTIPGSVTIIDDWAFSSCSALENLKIPNSVTTIGNNAFTYDEALKVVVIPNSVESIGAGAFAWCKNLKTISIPNSVVSIGSSAFNYIDANAEFFVNRKYPTSLNVTDVFSMPRYYGKLHVPEGTEADYAAQEGWNQFSNIVGDLEPAVPGDTDGNGVIDVADLNNVVSFILSE